MSDTLTKLERAGGSAILPASATLHERNVLAMHLAALKAQGHSVTADEVFEHEATSGAIKAIHYLSCRRCSGEE
jgi:hypothetical protein